MKFINYMKKQAMANIVKRAAVSFSTMKSAV